ncbi:MAG: YajQ family cyclic di-GMP-binding protein [Gammaproteobacteria bacterium]|nr:YajQ family cyclic di-GMP-binding protein [Gammaproteobacteria bacterium]
MPSFDVVSEVNMHEVDNAVDQANREVGTRFDFKDSNARYERVEAQVNLTAQSEFQLQQMLDIIRTKLAKRGVDTGCLDVKEVEISGREARQQIILRQGISAELGKRISKMVKDSKSKVQASIQGDKVRISGKNRDDLQGVIAMLRSTEFELPLQFNNFRD